MDWAAISVVHESYLSEADDLNKPDLPGVSLTVTEPAYETSYQIIQLSHGRELLQIRLISSWFT